ncbi:MAG: hypothetical protein ACXWUR_02340, partial [Allosphingosinicella sp.]
VTRKTGRKKKGGDRYPCGKLRPANDQGNDRVRAHRALYLQHGGVKASDDLDCAIGQAHAAGLLEGLRVDGRVLMEHGREWYRLYRATFGGGVQTRNLERIGRSEPSTMTTPTDLRYRNWAGIVAGLTAHERECLNLVCVEYGDGWSLPPFLERLVNAWKARQSPPLYVGRYLPVRGDAQRLDALKSALLAIVERSRRRRVG